MMAYINAEELVTSFEEADAHETWHTFEVVDKIEAFPTADVAEVRHGKWKEYIYDDYYDPETGEETDIWGDGCSECGELYPNASKDGYMYNYCPNCGAKMDLEG